MSEMQQPIIQVRNLGVNIKMDEGLLTPVRGVDFEIHPGETLGLVGESGCGKSLTSKAILAINDKKCNSTGEILFRDENDEIVDIIALEKASKRREFLGIRKAKPGEKDKKAAIRQLRTIRGKQISMIFQEPMTSLNPVFTIEKQVSEPFIIHQGMSKEQAKKKVVEMLSDVKIPNPEVVAKQYPHQLSGGMRQRVMIAIALSSGLKLVLADELTPDTCRLWDTTTGERMDKDRFRRDLGNVEEAYIEILNRVSR